jgi:hypothetical protein
MRLFALVTILAMLSACSDQSEKKDVAPLEYEQIVFPALIGGDVPDPKEWPNSVFGTSGNSGCSGTVVGERAYATAAHCMRDGATVRFSVGPNQYTAKCTHHSDYRQSDFELVEKFAQAGISREQLAERRMVTEEALRNATADWAMCVIDRPVTGGPFEVVNTNPALLLKGSLLTLTGYGCRKWGGPLDGKFRVGQSPIVRVPSPNSNDHDIRTSGKSALCSGDSGGAAYDQTGPARVLVGINSRSNTTTDSYIPSVAQPTAQAFFKSWASKNKVAICGIHAEAVNCRKSGTPPGPTEFTVDAKVATATVKLKAGFEDLYDRLRDDVTKLLESF